MDIRCGYQSAPYIINSRINIASFTLKALDNQDF